MPQRFGPVVGVLQEATYTIFLLDLEVATARRIALEQRAAPQRAAAIFLGINREIASASRNPPLLHRDILASHTDKILLLDEENSQLDVARALLSNSNANLHLGLSRQGGREKVM